jgi:hypothetical protein
MTILEALPVFDFFYLVQPGDVSAALELGVEKVLDDNFDFSAPLLRRQTADLSIVVQTGAVGGKDIIALGGPDSPHFVGGDAHADAGAAYQDTSIIIAPDNRFGNLHGNIRIISRIVRITAEIVIGVSRLGDYPDDDTFQSATPVVIADSNMHENALLYTV